VVASSVSFDNAYEIVDFNSLQADTFTVQAVKFRCDLPTWLGWAWQTMPM
jgi:transketolase N-terminal domain/subunit